MRVKHLDEIYTWKQIRQLQYIYSANPLCGMVPIAIHAPRMAREAHVYSLDKPDTYEWYGRTKAHYARQIWDRARLDLREQEAHALAYEIIPVSECFCSIRFVNRAAYRAYTDKFWELLESYANSSKFKCVVGRLPAREHPWKPGIRYEEYVLSDEDEYSPHDRRTRTRTGYYCFESLSWDEIKSFFVELTEPELTFLCGEEIVNRKPSALDNELLDACRNLDLTKMRQCLEAGANPNACEREWSKSALSIVVDAVNENAPNDSIIEAIDILINYGCDLDFVPYGGPSAFYLSSFASDTQIMKHLLSCGADLNTVSYALTCTIWQQRLIVFTMT